MRRNAASQVRGRVLELGVGVGANWNYLPDGIHYSGIEPDPFMIRRATQRMAARGLDFALQRARAERLPFADESFDTVLVTLSFCSVQNPEQALREVRRVLAPGGTLVFAEHVRPSGRVLGWLADRLTTPWRRISGGCNPNRRTGETIASAGLEIEVLRHQRSGGLPMIVGIARKAQPDRRTVSAPHHPGG